MSAIRRAAKARLSPRPSATLRGHTRYARQMVWRDQDPPAVDVLLDFTVPFSGGGSPAYLEIDKLPEGLYRATVGTLFEYQKLYRTGGATTDGQADEARAVRDDLPEELDQAKARKAAPKAPPPPPRRSFPLGTPQSLSFTFFLAILSSDWSGTSRFETLWFSPEQRLVGSTFLCSKRAAPCHQHYSHSFRWALRLSI